MKKGLTELVFILDRSGSMAGLESDTIGGFNSMIKRQREAEGDAFVSTVLFDHESIVIHDRIPLTEIAEMTARDYYTRGCTALLDAVGGAIRHIRGIHKYLPGDHVPEKTVFVIITDGMENASREFTYSKVKSMIGAQREAGWEFLFLGANIDAEDEAERLGICEDCSVTFHNDSKGVAVNFKAVNKVLCSMRSAECCSEVDASWKDDIQEYKKSREK